MLSKIIAHYGITEQSRRAIEELNELAVAINKIHRDHSKFAMYNLKQEIADVEIMIAQLKIMYGISMDEISEIKNKKINRVMERIKNETKA